MTCIFCHLFQRKPPPPSKPKPIILQKPTNMASRISLEKRKSLKEKSSSPKPPLPSRPPVVKKPNGTIENKQECAPKMDVKLDASKETKMSHKEQQQQDVAPVPLLRTMSGPVHAGEGEKRDKLRSISLQDKENAIPKPLPKPKPMRRLSNDANRPVPPPRSKRGPTAKVVAQPKLESQTVAVESKGATPITPIVSKDSEETSKDDKTAVMVGEKAEVVTDTDVSGKVDVLPTASNKDGFAILLNNKSNPSNTSLGSSHEIVVECKEINGERSALELTGESVISSTRANGVIELRGETSESRRNQSGDPPTFDREDNGIDEKTPEAPKRPQKNAYENVPSPFKIKDSNESSMNTEEREVDSKTCVIGEDGIEEEKTTLEEAIDDYENVPENGVTSLGTQRKNIELNQDVDDGVDDDRDYENVSVIERSPSLLDTPGGEELKDDFDSFSLEARSSPLDFGRLRIDAEESVADDLYAALPSKISPLFPRKENVEPTRAHSPQIPSLVQESYYQSPTASPQMSSSRRLFESNASEPDSVRGHKPIRRPPPEPPKFDIPKRTRARSNEPKPPEKINLKNLSSAKLLPNGNESENIYVAPRSENNDITSLRGESSMATDPIYKEPSISSNDSASASEPQEYSTPRAASPSSEYIDPDSFGNNVDEGKSMESNRQSYGESDSSASTRSSGGINLGNSIDNGYESVGEVIQSKLRSDSSEFHNGSEYVDMSPMQEEKRQNDREYLAPLVKDNQRKPGKKIPPPRPAPPPPMRPAKRPNDLPLPPVPTIVPTPIDLSKSESLDGRYERIQSLRREMGLPPTAEGEESDSDSDSEEDSTLKEREDEEKKKETKEGDGKPKSKLYHIAHEILTTERTFVNALRLVCDEFAVAAKDMYHNDPSSLPKHACSQMFDDIELIYDLDKKFLQELEDRMRDWDSNNRIGDIVRKYGYFLKMYTNYITRYDRAMAVFQECCQKMPKFAALVKEYERKPSFQNLKITSYMLKPIQRIPSYRLLLIDYLKHLSSDSKDHEDVSNGLTIVSEVAKCINESMKEGDKFQIMLKLQARIINNREIVKPGRYLIKEGILLKLSRKEAQERMFFLLTDCLLYCEHAAVSNQYKLREELPLARMTLDVPDNIDFNKEFTIITTKRSFTVVASSPEERNEWATALQNAIDDVSRKLGTFTIKLEHNEKNPQLVSPTKDIGQIAPKWVPDARATMCNICCRRFTAYNRRHHCRACGEIVCKDCSSYEAPIPYLDYDAARVCEKCYKILYDSLVEEDTPDGKEGRSEKSKLKRSKSAMSAKFKVVKKSKRDRLTRKTLPSTLTEVSAQEQECNISGYLVILKKKKQNKQKKRWFVLKEHALYSYKAPSDPAAHSTLAVLGYTINVIGDFDAGEYVFQLEHSGLKEPYVYRAESREAADMWVNALRKASSLSSV